MWGEFYFPAPVSVKGNAGLERGGDGAVFRGYDFGCESAGCFGGIPGVAQIYLNCFRT
jgi:hypothetical protein